MNSGDWPELESGRQVVEGAGGDAEQVGTSGAFALKEEYLDQEGRVVQVRGEVEGGVQVETLGVVEKEGVCQAETPGAFEHEKVHVGQEGEPGHIDAGNLPTVPCALIAVVET
jgi:hypothetical protein